MSNLGQFNRRTDVQDTDQVVGYRVAGAGGESRWTFVTLRQWLATLFAPADHLLDTNNPHEVTKGQVGLGNVQNLVPADLPVSTATQTALDAKANVSATTMALAAKADANATTAALALKAALASPAFTDTPTAPTASGGTSSTQLATTQFVAEEIAALINGAPGSLNTLAELAAAFGDDANFTATVTTAIALKLAKAANLSDLTDIAAARIALGLGSAATKDTGTGVGQVILGNDVRLGDARTPTTHTHPASQISDSTAAGRTLLTAADIAAQKAALAFTTSDLVAPPVYLMVGFKSTQDSYLYSFGSSDGKQWAPLQDDPMWTKITGETSVRDPRIFLYKGKTYVCYTTCGFGVGHSFGIITSDDLLTWTKVAEVDCSAIANINQVWGPKPFIDADGRLYLFIAVKKSTTGTTNTHYSLTPSAEDLTAWNAPVAITGLSANTIDGSAILVAGTYYFFFKDEDNGNIQMATATAGPNGPYTVQTTGDWAGFGASKEGISMVQITATKWRIYYELYSAGGFYWSECSTPGFLTGWSTPVHFTINSINYSNPGVLKVTDPGIGQKMVGVLLKNSSAALVTSYVDSTYLLANYNRLTNQPRILGRDGYAFFMNEGSGFWGLAKAPGDGSTVKILWQSGESEGNLRVLRAFEYANGVEDLSGSGAPSMSAAKSSTYRNKTGSTGSLFYVNQDGTGSGWIAIG